MTSIGDLIVRLENREVRLKPLTVRQLGTMQRLLGATKAKEALDDARHLGVSHEDALDRAERVRQNAMLTSWIIRWCFEIDGAFQIIKESTGGDPALADEICATMSPDELTETALALIGFEWDQTSSKWKSRSARSGRETESTSAS